MKVGITFCCAATGNENKQGRASTTTKRNPMNLDEQKQKQARAKTERNLVSDLSAVSRTFGLSVFLPLKCLLILHIFSQSNVTCLPL
uniref:Putative ovule protein n=1 Tax=Solanum chacoense TaxID=4108 RepID=A0A0V0HYF3_SOLCH